MQLSSGTHIPDGLLAANALLSEKLHQGSAASTHTLHQGFGVVISSTSLGIKGSLYDGDVRSRCTGKERDTESSLDYFGARYYSSNMGRFLSPDWTAEADPVPYADFENPQSLNLYSYVKNNPLSRTDPFGHADDPCAGIPNCASVTAKPDDGPPLISLGLAFGHHFVDQALVKSSNAGNSLAGQFFSRWRTGPLASPGLHRGFTTAHRLNSAQIQQIIKNVEGATGRSMSQWNQGDIEKAVEDVQNAGGEVDSFLSHIAENNPTARTVTADVQDIFSAAQAAMNRIQSSQAVQAVEGAAEEVEAACDGGPACIP